MTIRKLAFLEIGEMTKETNHTNTTPVTRGVNVSDFETLFIAVVNKETTLSAINQVPDRLRPVVFRKTQVTESDIDSFRSHLKSELGVTRLELSSNRNNRIGADLYEHNSRTHIEIKLGSGTDLNIGMNKFKKIFEGDVLHAFPSNTDRVRWRKMHFQEDSQKNHQLSEYRSKLHEAAAYLLHKNSLGEISLDQEFIDKLALGRTNIDKNERIKRFIIKPDRTWVVMEDRVLEGDWYLDRAYVTDKHRLTVIVRNLTYRVRFIYNQKNRYKSGLFRGNPADPKYGLGTPSFNGWVDLIK